jgi:hypothetical protein
MREDWERGESSARAQLLSPLAMERLEEGGGVPPPFTLFEFRGYFKLWNFHYNHSCVQLSGYLSVWNTFTIKGWDNTKFLIPPSQNRT